MLSFDINKLMKKLLFLIILLFYNILFSQEIKGTWYLKTEKVINSEKGYKPVDKGLLINFNKSELSHIATDTVIKIHIDYKKRIINIIGDQKKENLKFHNFKNDSIHIKFSENNVITTFHQFNLNNKLSKSRSQILNILTQNQFLPVRDSLKLEFSKLRESKAESGLVDKMMLKSKFLNQNERIGHWYLTKKKSNYFIGFSLDTYSLKYNIYQIISVEKNGVGLKKLIEYDWLPNLVELKTSLFQKL